MVHFTQSTAFATAMLEAAARLGGPRAAESRPTSDVGIRWLLAAHPFADAFVVQVGDLRDHEPDFATRRATTRASPDRPAVRLHAAAAAGRRRRRRQERRRPRDVLPAHRATRRPSPPRASGTRRASSRPRRRRALGEAGYPAYAGDVYTTEPGRLARDRRPRALPGDRRGRLPERLPRLSRSPPRRRAGGTIGLYDGFSQLGAADACGALGAPPIADPPWRSVRLAAPCFDSDGKIAAAPPARRVRDGRLLHLGNDRRERQRAARSPRSRRRRAARPRAAHVAAGARDYLLGRNPFGASSSSDSGATRRATRTTGRRCSATGSPVGAVVGGPAPASQVEGEGFSAGGPLQIEFATYEDERANYVTSEPALDYVASNVLLLAALEAHC